MKHIKKIRLNILIFILTAWCESLFLIRCYERGKDNRTWLFGIGDKNCDMDRNHSVILSYSDIDEKEATLKQEGTWLLKTTSKTLNCAWRIFSSFVIDDDVVQWMNSNHTWNISNNFWMQHDISKFSSVETIRIFGS